MKNNNEEKLVVTKSMPMEQLIGADEVEMVFVLTFWQQSNLDFDFPIIAHEFLKHEADSFSQYTDGPYFKNVIDQRDPRSALRIKFTGMILSAAYKKNAYAEELLRRIYKTYYKNEYRALKKFQKISFDEITGFENEEEPLCDTCARILTMTPFFNIELDISCMEAFRYVRDSVREMPEYYLRKLEFLEFEDGLLQESMKCAEKVMEKYRTDRKLIRKDRDIFKFKAKVFQYYGVSEDYEYQMDQEPWDRKRSLALTVSLLKKTFPKREFSDEQLQYYLEIFEQIKAYSTQLACFEDDLNQMFGIEYGYAYEKKRLLLKPFEIEEKADSRPVENAPVPSTDDSGTKEETISELKNENAQLKMELRTVKNNLKNAESDQAGYRRTIRELQAMGRAQEDVLQELYALREFAYRSTEDDVPVKEQDYQALEEMLQGKRIVIIGGHDNWTSQLRERFPKWVFVKPGASGEGDVRVMNKADAVYFFTDFISHTTYGKYVQYAREAGITFRYIHSTNIKANIRQIAADIE